VGKLDEQALELARSTCRLERGEETCGGRPGVFVMAVAGDGLGKLKADVLRGCPVPTMPGMRHARRISWRHVSSFMHVSRGGSVAAESRGAVRWGNHGTEQATDRRGLAVGLRFMVPAHRRNCVLIPLFAAARWMTPVERPTNRAEGGHARCRDCGS